jgi:hypothetical protein
MLRSIQRRRLCALVQLGAAAAALALSSPAECRGGLLLFDFDPNRPVIQNFDGSVTYDAASGDFNVQATNLFYVSPNTPTVAAISPGTAVIDLTVDQNGNMVGTGTYTLTGAIDFTGNVDMSNNPINDVSGTLLTGTVTAFGAASAGPAPWEFDGLISITGGLLTAPSLTLSDGSTFRLFRTFDDPRA